MPARVEYLNEINLIRETSRSAGMKGHLELTAVLPEENQKIARDISNFAYALKEKPSSSFILVFTWFKYCLFLN